MFATFMITLREGIEAFLIVAITLAYLRKTGRTWLAPAVYGATAFGVALSFGAAQLFREADNKPFWEGILAAIAALMVLSMVIYMMRMARRMRSDIASKIDHAAGKVGFAALVGVFAFVALMITREGMETALILTSLAFSVGSGDMFAGALIGTLCAVLLAWAWSRYGHRINLARFFQVTSLFLILFVVQLFIYAFHEFTEGNVFPLINNEYWHVLSEPYGPEGRYGQMLTYSMVILPVGWLVYSWLKEKLASAPLPQGRG
jgi:high-affinity iron transporter